MSPTEDQVINAGEDGGCSHSNYLIYRLTGSQSWSTLVCPKKVGKESGRKQTSLSPGYCSAELPLPLLSPHLCPPLPLLISTPLPSPPPSSPSAYRFLLKYLRSKQSEEHIVEWKLFTFDFLCYTKCTDDFT